MRGLEIVAIEERVPHGWRDLLDVVRDYRFELTTEWNRGSPRIMDAIARLTQQLTRQCGAQGPPP
jgi:hypothetical protein